MSRLVKNLRNNRQVVFDSGRFDDWCVYVVESNGFRNPPLDITYFSELLTISQKYPAKKVYDDFVLIFNKTGKNVTGEVVDLIDTIVSTYHDEDKIKVEQWYAVIYAGMIAEENKAHAILKKRIKRLGMYQVLIQGMPAEKAATFSIGKKWQDLNLIMRIYGF